MQHVTYQGLRDLAPKLISLWELRARQAAENSPRDCDWWLGYIDYSHPLHDDSHAIAKTHGLDANAVHDVLRDGLGVVYRRLRKRRG